MKRGLAAVAAVIAVPLLLAGCTDDAATEPVPAVVDTTPSAAASDGSDRYAPTLIAPADLADTTAVIGVGSALVLAVDDGTEGEWRGTTDDLTIAEFSAGGASEGAVFHPGFVARGVGTTSATLTGPDGTTVEFEITVGTP